MQKSFRLVVTVSLIICSFTNSFGQVEGQFKDVALDNKPAKLNVVTGEITLVNSEDKSVVVQKDSLTESSKSVLKDSATGNTETDYHIVKENETLLDIANRYKTTLTALKEANNLETTLVDKGQKLRVKNFETQSENDNSMHVITVDSSSTVITSSDRKTDIHIVKKDETLFSLAKRYNLTVEELKRKNGLSSSLIKVGQELNVSHSTNNNNITSKSLWTVSKGDTLYNISKRNGLTVDELKSLNGLTNNLILVGQTLKLK
ncbi:LysM peptidoglycan-binding domain-containing protein [uncultured Winogradskyella sp.]|uniref:LysM peptidoglycan-binding domain-containing protein n=1 Tax=uncultured Winogradskyella sp. TaxID=395353 RepID=UPI002613EE35|nr:LysM peptidoglycan-binding domain-containing protein [uncultured Winogradskyella sp.]